MEFGGFIGGFGKIFFTKGEIKRKGMGFGDGLGWEREKGGEDRGIFGKRWKEKEGIWVMYGKGCNMEYSLMECFL